MPQSSGLAAFGLFEAGEPNSLGHLQNHSLSPSLTCQPLKGPAITAGKRNEHAGSPLDDIVETTHGERVAIIGMALKMPGAESPGDLWQLINSGASTSTTIPLSRFDVHTYSDAARRGAALKTDTGNFVDGLDGFDNEFFNISPREAKMMDPQQRMLLHVAQEALEDAGFIPHSSYSSNPDHFGVFIGAATNDYVHNVRDTIDIHYISGTLPAFLSGRISYVFSLGGPSTVYDTACSSSAVALHAAVRSLQNGDCRMALAGGANAITSPDLFIGLDAAGFLSRTGQSRPFSAEAGGYSRGEGCGLFVLKRMSDALLDNDRIIGVIRGIEASQSYGNSSITRTHSPTQAALLWRLLEKSHIGPVDIDVVEAHAAGTKQGDTSELLAVRDVFLERRFNEARQAPLYVSSIKASIGHLEAASGAASLAKVLLMLRHRTIPQQIEVRRLNSVMDIVSSSQMAIPTEPMLWLERTDGKPRRAIINNYGAAGSNVSMLVEEYVEPTQSIVDAKTASTVMLGLSAKSEQALLEMKKRYIAWLRDPSNEGPLLDFCYTSTARRQPYKYRLSVTSPNNKDELMRRLEESSVVQVRPGNVGVVFVYPGHGSQFPGMGRVLYETCTTFRECVDECDALLVGYGLPTILPYLLDDNGSAAEEPSVVEHTALFSFQIALSKVWIAWGVSSSAVVGHSLGEYAALVASGALSLKDALLVVGRRAQLVENHCVPQHTGMMTVALPWDTLQGILQANQDFADLAIACRNSQLRQTVAGPFSQLKALEVKLWSDRGITSKLLPARFAYHSPAMLPAVEGLANVVKGVEFKKPAIPCASTVTGTLLSPGTEAIDSTHLLRHCLDPVQFNEAVLSLATTLDETGDDVCWIELSPQRALLSLIRTIIPNPDATHIFLDSPSRASDPWSALAEGLSSLYTTNVPVQWKRVFSCFGPRRCISLPSYPLQSRSFYVPYRDPSLANPSTRGVASSHGLSPSPSAPSSLLTYLQEPTLHNGRLAAFLLYRAHVAAYSEAHKLASIPMCPASAYLEAILTGVSMTHEHLSSPGRPPMRFSITHLEFLKPFVPSDHSLLDMVMTIQCNSGGDHYDFSFHSYLPGSDYVEGLPSGPVHACGGCQGQRDMELGAPLDLELSHVRGRIERLNPATRKDVEVFSAKSVYDVIFPRVVEYAPPFRSLQRVVVTEDRSEGYAAMEVRLGVSEPASALHPAYLDPMVHLPGFVLNLRAGQDELFICTGIGSVDLVPSAFTERTYQMHTAISPLTRDTWVADTIVLTSDSSKIVARLKNIQFKRIGRNVLTSQVIPNTLAGYPPRTEPLSPISLPSRSLSRRSSTPTRPSPMLPFKAILSAALHIPERRIADASTLESLGLDSLTSIEVLHILRMQHNPALSSELFQEYRTVGEVEIALHRHISPLRNIKATSDRYNCLEQIQEGPSTSVPICFIHDGSGSVASYTRLASLGRNVWAIKAPGIEAGGWGSIEGMAEFYASTILSSGPFSDGVILAGWSFGGVVAFEVAKRLLESGTSVRGVVLLDVPPPTGQALLSDELIASIPLEGTSRPRDTLTKQFSRHVQMMSQYRGAKLDPSSQVQCVYARCTEGYQAPAGVNVDKWFSVREDLATVAEWKALLGDDLPILDVPGHHFEMFHPSRIDSTSEAVSRACKLLDE